MTYEEAMEIVDAGGIVSRETEWTAVKAGFSWGPWYCIERQFTEDDKKREHERLMNSGWIRGESSGVSTGRYMRAYHTLCETVLYDEDDFIPESVKQATDWINVTDRFQSGSPKGYREYMYPDSTT